MRRERTGSASKALARRILADREDAVERARLQRMPSVDGIIHPEVAETPTFKAFADEVFLPHVKATLAELTHTTYVKIIKRVTPAFGSKRLGEIREEDIQRYLNGRREDSIKPATITLEWSTVSGVFRLAVKRKLIAVNPASGVERPKIPTQEVNVPTLDDIKALIENAPPHLRDVILFTAHTGLRTREVQHLRWADLRREEGYFIVRAGKGNKDRIVYLNTTAQDILKRQTASLHGFVFSDATGAPWEKAFTQTQEWAYLLRKTGVKCSFHGIRHHFASELLRAGASIMAAKALLGHSNLRYTERYCHVNRADLAGAVDALVKKMTETGQNATHPATQEKADAV